MFLLCVLGETEVHAGMRSCRALMYVRISEVGAELILN